MYETVHHFSYCCGKKDLRLNTYYEMLRLKIKNIIMIIFFVSFIPIGNCCCIRIAIYVFIIHAIVENYVFSRIKGLFKFLHFTLNSLPSFSIFQAMSAVVNIGSKHNHCSCTNIQVSNMF